MVNVPGSPTVSGRRLVGNSAANNGGAMHNSGGDPIVIDCTFIRDRAMISEMACNKRTACVIRSKIRSSSHPSPDYHRRWISCWSKGH